MLPRAPCSGIESPAPGCTDAAGELLWAAAWREATGDRLRFPAREAWWALMINSPNRRGQHQLHIHIASLDTKRTPPPGGAPRERWLLHRLLSPDTALSTDPSAPTRLLGEGHYEPAAFACSALGRPPREWARAYAVFVPAASSTAPGNDPGRDLLAGLVQPYALARRLAAGSDLPTHGYGIVVAPRVAGKQQDGLVVAIVWSTDDVEQLDVEELPDDPVGFSRTCANFAAAGDGGGSRGGRPPAE